MFVFVTICCLDLVWVLLLKLLMCGNLFITIVCVCELLCCWVCFGGCFDLLLGEYLLSLIGLLVVYVLFRNCCLRFMLIWFKVWVGIRLLCCGLWFIVWCGSDWCLYKIGLVVVCLLIWCFAGYLRWVSMAVIFYCCAYFGWLFVIGWLIACVFCGCLLSFWLIWFCG